MVAYRIKTCFHSRAKTVVRSNRGKRHSGHLLPVTLAIQKTMLDSGCGERKRGTSVVVLFVAVVEAELGLIKERLCSCSKDGKEMSV